MEGKSSGSNKNPGNTGGTGFCLRRWNDGVYRTGDGSLLWETIIRDHNYGLKMPESGTELRHLY